MSDHTYRIAGATGDWEVVMGWKSTPRSYRSPSCSPERLRRSAHRRTRRCLSLMPPWPGMLPVINQGVITQAVRTGLGLNAQINLYSRFDRKNYFYPDLPQGYQISQFAHPIVGEGEIVCDRDDGSRFTVGIERLHLEQDAASRSTISIGFDLCRPEPVRCGTDGDRVASAYPLARRGCGLCRQAAHDPALSRHLRRRYGKGPAARRCERFGLPSGRL